MPDDLVHYIIEGALGMFAIVSDKIFDNKSKADTDDVRQQLNDHRAENAEKYANKHEVTRAITDLSNKVDLGFQNINNNILRLLSKSRHNTED